MIYFKKKLIEYVRKLVIKTLHQYPDTRFFTHEFLEKEISAFQWKVGKYTYGRPKIIGSGRAQLEIGNYCSIADDVTFILANHNYRHISTFPFTNVFSDLRIDAKSNDPHAATRGAIIVGSDVWIAQGATLFPGVRIGHGACIGAGAYVRQDIPDYAIVIGNPAIIVKYRFSPETISRLLELKWWDWDSKTVIANKDIFLLPEHNFFLELENRNLI